MGSSFQEFSSRAGRWVGFPDSWRSLGPNPNTAERVYKRKIAVVIHSHYPELMPQLLESLRHIPVEYDLIVTRTHEAVDWSDYLTEPVAIERQVENRGRDIWPLIQLVNAGYLDQYDVVLKIHTKKSDWRDGHSLNGTGQEWRQSLLDNLLGSSLRVTQILSEFYRRPDLGLVTDQGSILDASYWGHNFDDTEQLLRRLELLTPTELQFAAGSMYWTRGFLIQGLRAFRFTRDDFPDESGQLDGTTAHAIERMIGILTAEAGCVIDHVSKDTVINFGEVPQWYKPDTVPTPRARVVASYLPQYHATPYNDEWWGRGFTEWASVTAAGPAYRGQQSLLPTELGFYNLTDSTALVAQAELALEHGLEGLGVYIYQFGDRPLLREPVYQMLAINQDADDGKDWIQPFYFPFFAVWANERWRRTWDGWDTSGSDPEMLIDMDYENHPPEKFIEVMMDIISSPGYMRVDGKPILAVYRINHFPNAASVVAYWRKYAKEHGEELFVLAVGVDAGFSGVQHGERISDLGIDGILELPPHHAAWDLVDSSRPLGMAYPLLRGSEARLVSYATAVNEACTVEYPDHVFPGVMCGFDNTPRRQTNPDIYLGANPYSFRRWLAHAVNSVQNRPESKRIVFVNGFNEWAERAVLEPSNRWGRAMLQAVRDVIY